MSKGADSLNSPNAAPVFVTRVKWKMPGMTGLDSRSPRRAMTPCLVRRSSAKMSGMMKSGAAFLLPLLFLLFLARNAEFGIGHRFQPHFGNFFVAQLAEPEGVVADFLKRLADTV